MPTLYIDSGSFNDLQVTGSTILSGSVNVYGSLLVNSVPVLSSTNFNNFTSSYNTGSFTGSFIGSLQGIATTASFVLSSSYASTASYLNTLNQDLTFNGNLILNGTASITYLNVFYESSSIIYSSGSNQFGDATNDTQTLIGRTIVSGSFEVTGSSEAWTGPPHNYKISGQWYSQAENATTYGTVAHATGSGTTNSIYMVPWIITRTQTFTSGAIENTASNSLLNARFGLYRANPTSSLPQTLVYDSGDINLSGTSVKIVSITSPLTLTPGLYYTAFTVSGSASTATMRSLGVTAFAAVIGLTTPGGVNNGSYINATRPWAVANANMAFPSNISTLTLSYTVGSIYATWFRLR